MATTSFVSSPVHDLLTARQVAERLGVSVRTLYRLVERGVLPQAVRYSRKLVRWKSADIDRYIAALSA
jgi:excisionase family DNA binding protein